MYVDSHCHLTFEDFKDDMDGILARANNAGVEHMVSICTTIDEFPAIHTLVSRHDQMSCTVGIHPHEAESQAKITVEELKQYATQEKVVGIGETGLDFYYEHAPRAIQIEQFRTHIAASRDLQIPLIVHTREAEQETLEVLKEEYKKGEFPGVIHCFTASAKFAEEVLKLGFYISISGIVTFKKATALQEIVKNIPLEKLLIETDSPYLAPIPNRGKRNEPSFVIYVAQKISEIKDIPSKKVAEVTSNNFYTLFNKVQRPA
jgi:TatD DNase family protein